jgi:hypothetical protein
MRKLLLFLVLLLGTVSATADTDYPYLTFQTSDGTKVSISVSELTISISGTTLTAGSESFTLSNISKMYFSTTDESSTDIQTIRMSDLTDDEVEIFDLQGKRVQKTGLRQGVYIVRTKEGISKIAVK